MTDWQSFHFLRPAWLAAGLLVVPWAALFLRRTRRSGAWRRVCDPHLLRHLLVDAEGGARRLPALLALAAWLAACVALAGPAWERLPQPVARLSDPRVLVLSLAPSMAATDVAPSRIERARFALRDALAALQGAEVGLVIYAEEPYAVTPLTDDAAVVEAILPVLEPSIMPGRGARLDRAIDEARSLLEGAGASRGRIVVVSDGPGQAPDAAQRAAENAARAGFDVAVLGIGPVDAASLGAIAEAGGGPFAAVGVGPAATASVVGSPRASLRGGAFGVRDDLQLDTWRDAGRALLWLPLLLAPLAFRRGWAGALALAGLLCFEPAPARAAGIADWFARPDQQAARAFAAGEHGAAAELFADPDWRAAALYRSGDYAGAAAALEGRGDPESVYNRGNALARSGELAAALAAYEQVLEGDPGHADARHNRDLVKKLLEEPRQSQQPQQQQQSEQQRQGEEPQQSAQQQSPRQQSPQQQSRQQQQPQEPQASDSRESEARDSTDEAPAQDRRSGSEDSQDPAQSGAAMQPSPEPAPGSRGGDEDSAGGERGAAAAAEQPLSESEQAAEQWLRRVPDDPAGLLREKLRRRYAEKRYLGGGR